MSIISGISGVTCGAFALASFLIASTSASAWDLGEQLEIHGFGGWAYAETDGNRYLLASSEGETENVQFALNLQARPHENLSIVAQINFESTLTTLGEEQVELDYAFAEWKFSDRLRARFGRVKHPIGIYGETFDVGTIRPFFQLPQSIYGPRGITAKSYNGVGLTGIFFAFGDDSWGIKYDLYGGKITGDTAAPGFFTFEPDLVFEPWVERDFEVEDMIGGKIDFLTPVPGMVFGFSAFQGRQETFAFTTALDIDYRVQAFHFEWIDDSWEVRAEWAYFDQDQVIESDNYYVEIARRFSPRWQVAARFDSLDNTLADPTVVDLLPGIVTLLRSEDFAVSLNYWFTPEFVARLEWHQIDGNRFAFPENPDEILAFIQGGTVEEETEAILFGVQFSF